MVAGNIDGYLNHNLIGNAFILPSIYISPRNVLHYGRLDLFIQTNFTNKHEQEIHRHDITDIIEVFN